MSKQMLQTWAEKIANSSDCHSSKSKFPKLMDFLKHLRWLIEYNEASLRKPRTANSSQPELLLAFRNCAVNHMDMHVLSPALSRSNISMKK